MSTTINEKRSGALAALRAMTALEQVATAYQCGESDAAEASLRARELAIQKVEEIAGPLSPFLSGFVSAMAEALYFHAMSGAPDYSVWKPRSGMTESELDEADRGLANFYAGFETAAGVNGSPS
ncbi:MAG TPA: hypothetical protein PKD38_16190 [Nitrospira sp.]|nr:hypothetical protein [Nitrospira sp.]